MARSTRTGAISARITAIATVIAVTAATLQLTTEPVFAASCTITGSPAADVIRGTEGDDVICGGGGDDIIYGNGGNDQLFGDNGDDIIVGGDGDDAIDGGNGDDSLRGQAGSDTLTGANGSDELDGGEGDDRLDGGNDADTVQGGAGDDTVDGGFGADALDGGPGDDRLIGGNGDDRIFGGFGADTLAGGRGDDELYGGPGADGLDGESGVNRCDGGTGADVFAACSTTVDSAEADPVGDWADTDADGAFDSVELRAGTDPTTADTDGDGLSDGAELLGVTDPTLADTDGDGVADAADDPDGDGLSTAAEVARGTRPGDPDTDRDTLTDGDEVARGTDPLAADTDGDGLSDSEEIALGADPLAVDSDLDGVDDGDDAFSRDVSIADSPATFQARGLGEAVLAVTLSVPVDDRLVEVPGQRAPPIEVDAPLPLESGTLTIPFDAAGVEADADLAVLHFDDDRQTFDLPPDQVVDVAAGTATVTTSDFSPFVLVDLDDFAAVWASEIATPRQSGGASTSIDVVLTIDSSGSMAWNDPKGIRKTAAKSFVDALLTGDRAAVVDFDSRAILRQALTTDFTAVKSAIDRVDSRGGTYLSAGMRAALDELDLRGDPAHERVIVFLTDGDGSYSTALTTRAVTSGTVVYTVGLGAGTNTARLSSIATATGGEFYQVASAGDLPGALGRIGDTLGEPDTDADGLADSAEISGWRDGSGRVFRTDPGNADTDGDGLSDGDEAGPLLTGGTFGKGTYYATFADPTKKDTDRDSLGDLYEVAEGLSAWKADLDRDGLSDAQETQEHSTEAFADDTDVDGYSDPWEIAHQNEGFDPLLYDPTITVLDYIGEFARGALCGDIEAGPFCEASTVAFLVGNIVSGVIAIGDVRDAIAGIVKLDFVSAGLSVAALIPIAGDAAAGIKKTEKFIKSTTDVPSGAALRAAMKDRGTTTADKMALLARVSPNAVSRLTAVGIPDETIVLLAKRMISAKHFDEMVSAASEIRKANAKYDLESHAEAYLRKEVFTNAMPTQILSTATKIVDGKKVGIRRFYDLMIPDLRHGVEIKIGRAYFVGRAGNQLENDLAILADSRNAIDTVAWHFFTNIRNTIGPDQNLLKALINNKISFTLWVA